MTVGENQRQDQQDKKQDQSAEISKLLAEMDQLFDGFGAWLSGQLDAESGGFYYAASSRRMLGGAPDIESTAQALNILERCDWLDAMSTDMKRGCIRFFQSKQESSSGYFYDDNPLMREDEVMVARAISYSLNALRKLGGHPLHALPYEAQQAPAYMSSPEDYLTWLKSVELTNSWRGCDRLSTSSVYVKQVEPESRRAEFAQTAFHFFANKQDPFTGLWGEGSYYVRISGTFKLHIFYDHFNVPLPREERIYQSILYALRHEEAVDMCYIRNPIHLLSYMTLSIPAEELREIISITMANMKRLLRADGGFSRELAHSPTAPNVAQVKEGEYYPDMPKAVHIGGGEVEGDMNAGTQALLIRSVCYQLAGRKAPPLIKAPMFTVLESN
ncbi:hypothetical protein PAECIP111891_05888 [Paenibacillus allorhizoplanae]|uniref:Glycosyl hydrolase n=1 Tax=Paenibacillus allorhizoplanae TaxID=2905648 RepID=A0ABM9CVT7_9BACL|nr:hypothetical protein [Paenibacillus allorhizoplanae]CAH1226072.1 hypothetical protein PAECIP111891_05888 [Paenibacillus allorhizoplanae]